MLAVGAFLTFKLGFFQFTHLGKSISGAFSGVFRKRGCKSGALSEEAARITPFQALATALGGSVGTANIAGVAGAIIIGGAGAIFWMWVAAFLGMATKLAEIVLAVLYRDKKLGHGGAMFYIERGMGAKFRPLAVCFALFGALASLVGTALVQSNTVALAAYDMFVGFGCVIGPGTIRFATGCVTSALVGAVILGGMKRIGGFSEKVVPFMALAYIFASLVVVLFNADRLQDAFRSILNSAFDFRAAVGGAAGHAFSRGVSRGVYSNEAGIGSAPMAYAEAQGSDPVRQGMLGIFEVFVDTIVMCTLTALVILTSGVLIPWGERTASGTTLALSAFGSVFPSSVASVFLAAAILLFAFTSIVGWSFYGVRCAEYLFGSRAGMIFNVIYLLLIPIGAISSVSVVWAVGETLNYLMAMPNVIALVALSGKVKRAANEYKMFEKRH